jgi:hypothetical protein
MQGVAHPRGFEPLTPRFVVFAAVRHWISGKNVLDSARVRDVVSARKRSKRLRYQVLESNLVRGLTRPITPLSDRRLDRHPHSQPANTEFAGNIIEEIDPAYALNTAPELFERWEQTRWLNA